MEAVANKDDVGMCKHDAIAIPHTGGSCLYCTEDALVMAVNSLDALVEAFDTPDGPFTGCDRAVPCPNTC